MVMAWSNVGHVHDQCNVLKGEGFPGFGHFGHIFTRNSRSNRSYIYLYTYIYIF
jgi:hypothetical protein